MVKVTVNGVDHEVEQGMTVLQACEQAGVEIPRFCYHDRLSVAGNCRMCLVEVKPGPPKPQASCALPVMEGQEIITNSEMVHKARHGVMEFLLINHPLDCPICDQGGECDLQDQAVAYGRGIGRCDEHKRAVADKYMGPIIKPIMTRCIHCTRCVRFSTEVAGVEDMGLLNRGEHAEISTLEKAVASELSGNLIDLCPVGALTSKPYAFHARPWELKKVESIDVSDALGANIRIDVRGNEVLRILPRLNEEVNEEWISDKARFACDGLKYRRLDRAYIRTNKGKSRESTWDEAFQTIGKKASSLKGKEIGAIAGDLVDVEAMYALRHLLDNLQSPNMDCRQDGMILGDGGRASYLFNSSVEGIEKADMLLIIGCNPRHESPVLNARIRKSWLYNGLEIGLVGEGGDLTYDYTHLGADSDCLKELASGNHAFAKKLKRAKNPMVIVGGAVTTVKNAAAILQLIAKICAFANVVKKGWNGYNILHSAAARVGGLDIGFIPKKGGMDCDKMIKSFNAGKLKILYLLGADEVANKIKKSDKTKDSLIIYQGHHGDAGAHIADVILPGAAYTEKNGIYVNMEGRVQMAYKANFAPGDAKDDWAIIRALSDVVGAKIAFDSHEDLRKKLYDDYPHMRLLNEAPTYQQVDIAPVDLNDEAMENTIFKNPIADFYKTNTIARASKTMTECSDIFVQNANDYKESA